MYDPTIHAKTLGRQLAKADFYSDPNLANQAYKQALIGRAVAYGCQGFPPASLKHSPLRGKTIYGYTDLAEALVLRHITSNIRRITSVKQDNRSFIVNCINLLVSEGVPFRVYKYDIAKFYESVHVPSIIDRLQDDVAFSGQSVRALASFFSQLAVAGIHGLPRGLALSATLAEYLMRGFDRRVSSAKGVWYYARFVDDILIITDGREDAPVFRRFATQELPQGLTFNQKSKVCDFAPFVKGNTAALEAAFDFLGYRFEVSKAWRNSANRIVRSVGMDIAPSKVRKLKTRVARSLLTYAVDHSFDDLRDRLRMLTANVVYVDKRTGVRRPSGLHFNYPLVDPSASQAVAELDRFVRSALMSPHPKNRFSNHFLSAPQRQELAGLTFKDGFRSRRFFHVPTDRLTDLAAVWAYV
jgi:hypothetical protein